MRPKGELPTQPFNPPHRWLAIPIILLPFSSWIHLHRNIHLRNKLSIIFGCWLVTFTETGLNIYVIITNKNIMIVIISTTRSQYDTIGMIGNQILYYIPNEVNPTPIRPWLLILFPLNGSVGILTLQSSSSSSSWYFLNHKTADVTFELIAQLCLDQCS